MADGKRSSKQGKTCHLLNIKNAARAAERLKLTFQRVDAKLYFSKAGKEMDVGLTLIDVSESGAGLYCSQMLTKGVAIELSIFEPRILKIRGMIAWCVPAESRMSSLVVRYPYRCGIQFIYDSPVQKAAVQEFMQKIREKQIPGASPVVKAPPSLETQAGLPSDVVTPPLPDSAPTTEVVAPPTAPAAETAAPAPAAEATAAPAPETAIPDLVPTPVETPPTAAAETPAVATPTEDEKKAA